MVVRSDVHLKAREGAELREHSQREPCPPKDHRWIVFDI